MDVRICDALPAHVPEIAAIEQACFSVPWTEDQIRSQQRRDA